MATEQKEDKLESNEQGKEHVYSEAETLEAARKLENIYDFDQIESAF